MRNLERVQTLGEDHRVAVLHLLQSAEIPRRVVEPTRARVEHVRCDACARAERAERFRQSNVRAQHPPPSAPERGDVVALARRERRQRRRVYFRALDLDVWLRVERNLCARARRLRLGRDDRSRKLTLQLSRPRFESVARAIRDYFSQTALQHFTVGVHWKLFDEVKFNWTLKLTQAVRAVFGQISFERFAVDVFAFASECHRGVHRLTHDGVRNPEHGRLFHRFVRV